MGKIFGNEFYKINKILGEPILVFSIDENQELSLFHTQACFKPSTRATYNFEARAYSLEGTFNDSIDNPIKNGQYFIRLNEFDKKSNYYFIESHNESPTSNNEIYCYCFECNSNISVARLRTNIERKPIVDEDGNHLEVWKYLQKDIPAYLIVATRSFKLQNDGSLDQTIYTLHVPSITDIKEFDRIVINYKDGSIVNYQVDSVGRSLKGIYILQLSFDLRDGIYVEER